MQPPKGVSADYQAQLLPRKEKTLKRKVRRHQLEDKLAEVMAAELLKLRMESSSLGDEFEMIKTKVRFRLSKEEIRELCQCMSAAIVTCNHLCNITEKREPQRVHTRIIGR